jgi:hypothetical protein
MRAALTSSLAVILAGVALAATSAPPSNFGDVPLGASLHELKARYPEASRNPDSDRHFQVYQVPNLHGATVKSAGAFQIYQGHVVGGQILLDTHNAQHWLDAMTAQYGKPDRCTYCDDAQSATAVWHWENGTTLKVEGGMLTELTSEGTAQRSAWMARASSDDDLADNGDEASDEGETTKPVASTAHKHRHMADTETASAPAPKPQPQATGWRGYYDDANSRLEHWLGWSK